MYQAWALARRVAGDVDWAPPGTFPPRIAGELLEIIKGLALSLFKKFNGDQSPSLTALIIDFLNLDKDSKK
jgi:hypothetical protein